jgi:hypothetical protein
MYLLRLGSLIITGLVLVVTYTYSNRDKAEADAGPVSVDRVPPGSLLLLLEPGAPIVPAWRLANPAAGELGPGHRGHAHPLRRRVP